MDLFIPIITGLTSLIGVYIIIRNIKKDVTSDLIKDNEKIQKNLQEKIDGVHNCLEKLEEKTQKAVEEEKEQFSKLDTTVKILDDKMDKLKEKVDEHIGWSRAKTEVYDKFLPKV